MGGWQYIGMYLIQLWTLTCSLQLHMKYSCGLGAQRHDNLLRLVALQLDQQCSVAVWADPWYTEVSIVVR